MLINAGSVVALCTLAAVARYQLADVIWPTKPRELYIERNQLETQAVMSPGSRRGLQSHNSLTIEFILAKM